MKSLLVYMKEYKKECVFAPLFKLLEVIFDLCVPLVMARMVDVGIGQADSGYILKLCGVLILLGALGLATTIIAQYFAAKAAAGFAANLRHALFERIQEFTFSQMDLFGTDTLITRMTSDINQVQSGVNMALRLFLRSPFIVFGSMVMAFTVDKRGALVFAVTIPILFAVVFGILLWTMPLYRKVQTRLDAVTKATRENLTGVRVIRAFNKEDHEISAYEADNRALALAQKVAGGISGLMNPVTYVILNLAMVALLKTGAIRINAGVLTQGQLIALINYMSQILVELIKLANMVILTSRAWACGDRVEEVLRNLPEMKDGSVLLEPSDLEGTEEAVRFDHVSFKYGNDAGYALEDISFRVKKGQTVGIIGGTGSGKSSLVNLIPRFYDASEGSVSVFGKNVKDYRATSLRSRIGMVLQKAELFKGSIADNLRWGKADAGTEELEEALAISQAKEYVDQKPGGTEYLLEQNARNLSGGQKQRLTIARALMKKPDILILDDSASALDFATDAKLRMAIRKAARDMTTFIVSQRAASVRDADLILVLDDGKLVGRGTHEDLMRDNEIYREIYESQFPGEDDDE